MLLEGGIEVVNGCAEPEQLVGLDVVVGLAERRQPPERELLRRADRTPAVPLALRIDDGIRRRRIELDADLLAEPEQPGLFAEGDQSTAREVEHRRRQRASRRAAVHDHGARRGGEIRRRGRDVDRRRVEVDRVLAVASPVEEPPAKQTREDSGAPIRPMTALSWRPCSSRAAFSGVATSSMRSIAARIAAVPVVTAKEREHVVLEDLLAFAVGQERGRESWRGVELDLAARATRLEVEEDRESVVEALAADAPLVDERQRVALGLLGRGGVDDLRVDHHLGLRPLLDAIDGLLDRSDRLGLEDAGEVVDGPVDLRLRERRPGRWRIGGRARVRGGTAGQLALSSISGRATATIVAALRSPASRTGSTLSTMIAVRTSSGTNSLNAGLRHRRSRCANRTDPVRRARAGRVDRDRTDCQLCLSRSLARAPVVDCPGSSACCAYMVSRLPVSLGDAVRRRA